MISALFGIGAALAGAGVFYLIGFPSAALTGSAAAVSVAGLMGAKIDLPIWLRNVVFVLLGLNIGSAVTPEMLAAALGWPVSIAILAVSLVIGLWLGSWGLVRLLGFAPRTAVLAATPGHLSFVLALAADSKVPVTPIAMVQSIRVLFLTLCVPALVATIFGATGWEVLPAGELGWIALIALVCVAAAGGFLFQKLRVPAAFLISGMVISAAGHVWGLTPGKMPPALLTFAMLSMGTLIGSRFSGVSLEQFKSALGAGVWITLVNVALASLAVIATLMVMDVPPAQLIVSFAPGGVEAMAAIGLSLGMDPAFVAAHHLSRLVILSFVLPIAMGLAKRRSLDHSN